MQCHAIFYSSKQNKKDNCTLFIILLLIASFNKLQFHYKIYQSLFNNIIILESKIIFQLFYQEFKVEQKCLTVWY
jgi:hypothetical protein